MNKYKADNQPKPDPDCDGHLERPLQDMTTKERLDWAWRMMQLRYWAKHEVEITPNTNHRDSENTEESQRED